MHILRISSLNVNGARNREKQGLLNEFLKLKDSHVTFYKKLIVMRVMRQIGDCVGRAVTL